jgi:hypothetical protein
LHPAIHPAVAQAASHFFRERCHVPSMQSKLPQREHFQLSRLFRYCGAIGRPPDGNGGRRNVAETGPCAGYSGFGFFSPGHLPVVR